MSDRGHLFREQRHSLERLDSWDVRFERHRQDAGRRDHEACGEGLSCGRANSPPRVRVVPVHCDDLGIEFDVTAQVQTVGDEVEIGLDLGLGGHVLGPHPFLLDLIGEAVRVLDTLDVATCSRVAVEQPRPADRVGLLHDRRAKTEFAGPMQGIETGEPRPDHHDLEVSVARFLSGARHCRATHHHQPPRFMTNHASF
jgi:hypothetical protein